MSSTQKKFRFSNFNRLSWETTNRFDELRRHLIVVMSNIMDDTTDDENRDTYNSCASVISGVKASPDCVALMQTFEDHLDGDFFLDLLDGFLKGDSIYEIDG
jgi:hypothetical protein